MKLAFSTLGCPNWGLAEILSTAKDLGYTGIEIRGIKGEIYAPRIKELTKDKTKTLAELNRLGLRIPMLTSSAVLAVPGEEEFSMREAGEYIDLACDLGVEFVRVMSTGKPQFEGGDVLLFEKQYKKLVRYAEEKGVTPLVETNGLFVDTKLMASVLENTGGGALWDVHHPYRFGGEKVEETAENLGRFVKYVHIKDSVILPSGKVKYKMMGYGDIPVDDAVNVLRNNGYDGFFTLEWVKRWNTDLEDGGVVFPNFVSYMKLIEA